MTNKTAGNLTIARDTTAGTGFSIQGLSLPLTLSPGESYTFKIAFSPNSTGAVKGWFRGVNSGGNTLAYIPLTGNGTAAGLLSLSPSSAAFGSVDVGSTSSKTGTLSASGASVTITSASSSSSEFMLSGISFPETLAAGQSTSYTVTFKPQASGAASTKLVFQSNASDSVGESLTGTGVAAQAPSASYTVSLSWDASTSSVAGYNVYRGSNSGGPYTKLNSGLDSGTTYTDTTVAASNTYYYVTTAVNSGGQESAHSNQVEVVIP
jgi:Abnormal spindle-like microcephaly-assoc'd, ASPM-SPD-2-Hydin